jgi:hypothetical protein
MVTLLVTKSKGQVPYWLSSYLLVEWSSDDPASDAKEIARLVR